MAVDIKESKKYSDTIYRLRYDGKINEAIAVCKDSIRMFPDNNFFYKVLGDLFIQKEDFQSASQCYLEQLKHMEGKGELFAGFAKFYKKFEKNVGNTELRIYRGEIFKAINKEEISKDVAELLKSFLGKEFIDNPELRKTMLLTDDDQNLNKVKNLINNMVEQRKVEEIRSVLDYRIESMNQNSCRKITSFLISTSEHLGLYDEALRLIRKNIEQSRNTTMIRTLLRICRIRQDYTFAEDVLTMDRDFILKSDFNIQYELVYYYENNNEELLDLTLKMMRTSATGSIPIARTLYNFYLRFNMFDEAKLIAQDIKKLEENQKGSPEGKRIEEQFESEQGIWNKLQELVSEQEHNRQMIAMRDLIKGFSHELGQPVTNIRYSIQLYLMKEQAKLTAPVDVDVLLKLILTQTERIGNMLARFRPIVSSKSMEIMFSIHERVNMVLKDLSRRLQAHNIRYSLMSNKESFLWGDPIQFDQIFYNLILNSMQAITATGKDGNIYIRIKEKRKGEILIVFCDDGPGISQKNAKKVFEPFFTTKDPSTENGGEGLGLFIVWNILKIFNGKIELDNEYKKGAKFIITIVKPQGDHKNE